MYVLHVMLIVSASVGGILMPVNPDGSLLGLEIQLLLTSYFWMHPVMIFLALLIIFFTMIPANIRYFAEKYGFW